MAAKSGKAVTAVVPTDPEEAFEADDAKPGEVAKVKAKQIETKTGKYGTQKVPAHKPPAPDAANVKEATNEEDEITNEKNSWIEIELRGEDDSPIAGEKYKIETPDGTLATGTLDKDGFARVEGFSAGDCKVSFPKLDKDAWEKA
jgi:hypothetical protein